MRIIINRKLRNKFKKKERLKRIYAPFTNRFNLIHDEQDEKETLPTTPIVTEEAVVEVNEDELVASICQDSFFEFMKEFWEIVVPESPVWNWHIKYLCDELQFIAERIFKGQRKIFDLAVNIAPGTTKSLIMSVMLPAWCMTRMPSFKFIGASYSFPLAMDLSMKCRDIVSSDKYRKYFPHVALRPDQNTKGYFKTTQGGWRYAVGVNGAITGMHAHMIVIDDPLNPQEAQSTADIATANHWIKHTLSNRKVDKAITPMILVMQRLHQDDPTAQFLKNKKVKHICLPAEIEPGVRNNVKPADVADYYVDGMMDPIRMGPEVLKEEKAKGEYYYSSQFRQDPVPAGGGMFKTARIKTDALPTKWRQFVRFWDKAGTKDGGAFTVGVKIGQDIDGRFWVLDVVRVQLDSFERERLIQKIAKIDGYETVIGIEQEGGSGGKESAEGTAKNLHGYKVRIVKADATTGGKIERADPWSVQMNAGNVYMPLFMKDSEGWLDWAHDFVEEHKYFPFSKYKDQVDAASGALMLCTKKKVRVGGFNPSAAFTHNNPTNPLSMPTPRRKDAIKSVKRGGIYSLAP